MLTKTLDNNQRLITVSVILIVSCFSWIHTIVEKAYAGTPAYLGQVEILMVEMDVPRDKIEFALSLPPMPVGTFLAVSKDYKFCAIVTSHENGTISVEKMYSEDEIKKKRAEK